MALRLGIITDHGYKPVLRIIETPSAVNRVEREKKKKGTTFAIPPIPRTDADFADPTGVG